MMTEWKDMGERLTKATGVRLKHEEVLALGQMTQYYLGHYAECEALSMGRTDTLTTGEAARIYGLWHKLAGRALQPRRTYTIGFSPSEQETLLRLLDYCAPALGVYERTVSYRLREELHLTANY